jgi:hypothetical protein
MGGRRPVIPEHLRTTLRERLERHPLGRWTEHCRGIERFRGAFAYVDAFPTERWDPRDTGRNP